MLPQLVKKFPAFYGCRKFFILFTKTPPLVTILNQINPVNTYLTYLFHVHVNIILRLNYPCGLLTFRSRTPNSTCIFHLSNACYIVRQFNPPWRDRNNNFRAVQIMELPYKFQQPSLTSSLFSPNAVATALFWIPPVCVVSQCYKVSQIKRRLNFFFGNSYPLCF